MDLDRDYTVVRPRDSVAVIVLAVNPNSINSFPNSVIVFTAPSTEGCYQYKAEGTNVIRSEAFYSSVINNFAQ